LIGPFYTILSTIDIFFLVYYAYIHLNSAFPIYCTKPPLPSKEELHLTPFSVRELFNAFDLKRSNKTYKQLLRFTYNINQLNYKREFS